jgi:hypothetical protein
MAFSLSLSTVRDALPPYLQRYTQEVWRETRRALAVDQRDNGFAAEVVAGGARPCMEGAGAHYVTRAGRWIQHPAAYSKRGFSNMVYIHGARRAVVGRGWLFDCANAHYRAAMGDYTEVADNGQ